MLEFVLGGDEDKDLTTYMSKNEPANQKYASTTPFLRLLVKRNERYNERVATIKRRGELMYYIGLLIFVILLVVLFSFSATLNNFIDIPSIIVVLGFSVPIVMAAGLLSDFVKGFKLMAEKVNPFSVLEVKRILLSVQLMIKMMLLSGFVGTMSALIVIFSKFTTIETLFNHMSVAIITLFYALILTIILLPIEAKAKAVIASLE